MAEGGGDMKNGTTKMQSNIYRFLACTMPSVVVPSPADKRFNNNLRQSEKKDEVTDFMLEDLWDDYREWSVYGAGVPILLNSGETVVQYYVPYLSAMQIITHKFHANLRINIEESETDSWSDDSEFEKFSRSWDSVSDDSGVDQDWLWTFKDKLGHLYLQYIEKSPPSGRIPLMDKIKRLAYDYPGLSSFKSTELSPASWMSVAWYPIYTIPSKRSIKELSACFLTYHTISSQYQENTFCNTFCKKEMDLCCAALRKNRRWIDEGSSTFLFPFGLATYKMKGGFWLNPEVDDEYNKIGALNSAAQSWLKQLGVAHHDFNYFNGLADPKGRGQRQL